MRAYITRFSDISELETWVAHKIPLGLSLDYDRLRGKGPGPNGHIAACVAGFTKEGDPIMMTQAPPSTSARYSLVKTYLTPGDAQKTPYTCFILKATPPRKTDLCIGIRPKLAARFHVSVPRTKACICRWFFTLRRCATCLPCASLKTFSSTLLFLSFSS